MTFKPAPHPLLGETLQLTIEQFGSRGEGLARHEGNQIFVAKTSPGDVVEAHIDGRKKSKFQARSLKLLKSGPGRQSPSCKHFNECGGCDLQHMSYQDQIKWKREVLNHWISRSRLAQQVKDTRFDVIESPKNYSYRHRVRIEKRNNQLFFKKSRSHELVKVEECPVLQTGFFEALKKATQRSDINFDRTLSFSDDKIVEDKAHFELGGFKLFYGPDCFTQANLEVNRLMWKRISEDASQVSQGAAALDLFCGMGNYSVPLSRYFSEVLGIESSPSAVKWARFNSHHHDLEGRVQFQAKPVSDFLSTEIEPEAFDYILVDPPRAGLGIAARRLKNLSPERLTFVSCQLDSLIRDLGVFLKKNSYRIERWTLVDLLPQTKHIESIVSLIKS